MTKELKVTDRGKRTRRATEIGVVCIVVLLGTAGAKLPSDHALTDNAAEAKSVQATDEATPRMKHPAHGYVMYIAYFETHQIDADMNMDVQTAIESAAEAAKTNHVSLVITCHGEDALVGGVNVSSADLANGRLETIISGLVAHGVAQKDIVSDWGDPKMTAAAAKLQGPMLSDRPTCDLETAVPVG
jgi:hypothetical protein